MPVENLARAALVRLLTAVLELVLILMSLVAFSSSYMETETKFPRQFDFRFTSYKDLLSEVPVFQHPDVVGYIQMSVDVPRNQLIVGARGCLFRLSLDDLSELEMAVWQTDGNTTQLCQAKGQPAGDCHNFIRVLILHENGVFVCGTNAFSPLCTWRSPENLTDVIENVDAAAKCPYNPHHNTTALMTADGDLYSATVIDITARDPAIFRTLGNKPPLRTVQYNSKWLNEPDFVSSYDLGDFVYFFFREAAVEYINCGKKIYSRVARICKNDRGGDYLFKDYWTTYLKARLNCSVPGDYPFYFDEIQATYYLESEELMYAVFNTPMNSLAGSAVCVYNLTAFNTAFTGPYKYQENVRSAWVQHENINPLQSCPEKPSSRKRSFEHEEEQHTQMITGQNYQIMDWSVQPVSGRPILYKENERWTNVVVDSVTGKHHDYLVFFVATADGKIRKMVNLPNHNETCLIEEIKIVPNGEPKPVKVMKMSHQKEAIYISTQNHVIKVPVHRCHRFNNSDLCLNANDPYCGWNEVLQKCTSAPGRNPTVHYWFQSMRSCPVVEHPIDGAWSVWSPWSRCQQVSGDNSDGDCLCRSRLCNSPEPLYGGRQCQGMGIEVMNCTAHGQWTEWSEWSSCSQTCGTAIRTRQRHCGNPPPRYGGRGCIGASHDESYCVGSQPCPVPPTNGNWSAWSAWSDCTAQCNGGIQTRRRNCDNPPAAPDGIPCIGNKQEWRMCNTHLCEEIHRFTPWSPWIKTNNTGVGYFEQRFRFSCRANVPSQKMIKASHLKTQLQFCYSSGKCVKSGKLKHNKADNNVIDTSSPVDRVLKKYCRYQRRLFKKYCRCKSLGIFLVCQKCGYG